MRIPHPAAIKCLSDKFLMETKGFKPTLPIHIPYFNQDIPVAALIVGTGDFNKTFFRNEELFGPGGTGLVQLIIDIPIDCTYISTRVTGQLQRLRMFATDQIFISVGGGKNGRGAFAEDFFT